MLSLKGAAAAGVDTAAVYAVKGEAQLHLKAYPVAADSFAAAAKAAADPAAAAADKATEILARRSKNGLYTPKQPGAGGTALPPIDVTDKAKRKDAFAALFADEYAADAAKLKAGETSKDVTTALAAVDLAVGLRALEGGGDRGRREDQGRAGRRRRPRQGSDPDRATDDDGPGRRHQVGRQRDDHLLRQDPRIRGRRPVTIRFGGTRRSG